jgi:hypothetical protein
MDYLVKFGLFGAWLAFLYYVLDYFTSYIFSHFQIPALPWLQAFGIIGALNLFISITVSCFLAKQILRFWSSS